MRRGKPIDLHIIDGKSHFTKAEIEFRQENEIRLGGKDYVCPDTVAADPLALKKWNELVILYRGFDFVSDADSGILERYCLTYSEYWSALGWEEHQGKRCRLNELLIKLEDRLLLNPVSRVRSVPKKQEKKEVDPLEKAGFGNV